MDQRSNQQTNSLKPQTTPKPEILKEYKSPRWAIVCIAAFSVIVVGLVSYGAYRYFAPRPESAELPTAGEEELANEFANWQTYRNEEYGFEIKHPEDWEAWEKTSKIHLVALGFGLKNHKIESTGLKKAIFNIYVYSKKGWEETQSWGEDYKAEKLGENNKDYILAYRLNDLKYSEDVLKIISTFNAINNWQVYRNEAYDYEIELPAHWVAYSEYDGSVIEKADSPENFPDNPLILTGTPRGTGAMPILNFQIEFISNMTVSKYKNSFLGDVQQSTELQVKSGQTGIKLAKNEKVFFLIEMNNNLLKVYSSDSEYIYNDRIFTSIKFIEPESTSSYKTYQGDFFEVNYSSAIWTEENCKYQLCSVEFADDQCVISAGLWRNKPWNPVNITTWEIGEYSPQVKEWAKSSDDINEIEVIFDIEDVGTRSFDLFIFSPNLYEKCQDNFKELLSTVRFIEQE